MAAARRVKPWVHTLFVDDAAMVHWRGGLRRVMMPVGQGMVDWPRIVRLFGDVPLRPQVILDIHRAELELPMFDTDWSAYHPDASIREILDLYSGTSFDDSLVPEAPAIRFEKGVGRLQEGF